MDVLARNTLPKVHRDLHLLRSLAMTRPQLTALLLNFLLLSIQKKICRGSLGRFSKPELPPLTAFVKSHWRPDYLTSIVVSPTWNATNFISRVKITLLPPEPRALTVYLLLLRSFVTVSTSDGNNISKSKIALFQSLGMSSKRFFGKV